MGTLQHISRISCGGLNHSVRISVDTSSSLERHSPGIYLYLVVRWVDLSIQAMTRIYDL